MKASYVSSQAITQALRYSMSRMQSELVVAQKEVATGRVADPGLTLGARTGQSVSLARDVARLAVLADSNALVASRLSSTQDALSQLSDRAEELRATLTAAVSGSSGPAVARADAKAMMETLTAILNTSINGEHLFAGTNTDVQPLADFADPASPNRVAFDQAFLTTFGFSQDDPAAAGITPAAMESFLTNVVEPQFLGSGWTTNWSSATDDPIVSRIALNETAQTSVSANISGVRKLAMAAAITSLVGGTLNSGATASIVSRALALVAEGIAEISDQKAKTGLAENRVANATARITMQGDIFESTIQDMEGVDPYEASTRVSALITQIETSYTLTARIQGLSLLRFLT
ncbi:MAG: flagellar hook-associated family protein [Mesorhizobium sp.]|nr:flagellar hook-associated family protein [Mesorhizobium sp.]